MSKPLKLFITYSHQDKDAKDKLIECLAVMRQKDLITTWHDNEILPGDKWREAISNNLTDSDILLYLVSASSLASKNCNKELGDALGSEIRVIPIILESCDWQNHQLRDNQALPDKGKPINEWKPESKAWQNVVYGIRKIVNKMQAHICDIVKKETLSEWAFRQGNFLMTIGQVDRAIEAYSHAIELDPKSAVAYGNRGVTYDIKGYADQAIADLNKAIELKPVDAVAYYNRGIVYRSKGDIDRAIEDYTKAIELSPDRSVAYYNRGFAYYVKGTYDRAIEDYSQVIELDPDHNAYFARSMCWLHLQNWQEAKSDLIIAKNRGMDIISAFHGYYRNVETFGRRSGVLLPEDIATMLTQRRRSRFREKKKKNSRMSMSNPLMNRLM